MSRSMLVLVMLGGFLALSAAVEAAPHLKPGKWQITTRIEIPGMPVAMPARTITKCFTGSDPKQGVAAATQHSSRDGSCRADHVKIKGNKVTWQLQCSGAHAATGHGEISYLGDHYTGQTVMDVNEHGHAMVVTNHTLGKYIGACN